MQLKIKVEVEHQKDCPKPGMLLLGAPRWLSAEGKYTESGKDSFDWQPFLCSEKDCPCRILVRVDTIEQAVARAVAEQVKE